MTKGLVLAGGGAKGSYQVGVYKALDELDWRPGVIAGTSVGCLNGALFALDDWELAQEMWLTIGDGQVMEPAPDGRPADWGDFLQAAVEHGGEWPSGRGDGLGGPKRASRAAAARRTEATRVAL